MKKLIKMLALMLITITAVTGCSMKEEINIEITKDKNVSIESLIAMDDELIDALISMQSGNNDSEKTYTDEERWAYIESSDSTPDDSQPTIYQVTEKYQSENYKGKKYIATDLKLDSLVKDNNEEITVNDFVNSNKMFKKNGNEYTLVVKKPQSVPQEDGSEANINMDPDAFSEIMDIKFSVTLPYPAKSNNATEISNNNLTYEWDLTKFAELETIELVFEIPDDEIVEKPDTEVVKKQIWQNASGWAEKELEKAINNNLIPEVLEGKDFIKNINRKEFAAVSVKLYEAITKTNAEISANNPFVDTDDSYVLKAYNLGITKGTTEKEFSPEASITREQMATMLVRALSIAKINTTVDLESAKIFADDKEISNYARESVYFMSNNGIIKGINENNFGAKKNCTIEQAVIVALRSAEELSK